MRCVATARSGERCRKSAIDGAVVCRFHGGAAPQVKRAAQRRLAEQRVRRALDEVDVPEIMNPVAAFRQICAEAVALKGLLADHVAVLDELAFEGDSADQLQAVVGLYERAMDRAAKFLETWVRLDLDERLVRMSERDGDTIVIVIERVLIDLGGDFEKARALVAKHIRAVQAEVSRDGMEVVATRSAVLAREAHGSAVLARESHD